MKIEQIIQLLKMGKVGVLPTDTVYGIVGSALNPKVVEEIYRLRKRSKGKPMIILIFSIDDLKKFDVELTGRQRDFLKKIWPNPVSVILPCLSQSFSYLHRGVNSLAFRIPKDDILLRLLKKTGPLVAPSANFEGENPSQTLDEAKKYFADKVAFYIDGGRLKSLPSTIIELKDNSIKILREGSFNPPKS